ncbi:hypothetical protein ONZ45_g16394 [Pleurotus djamor]|nr:hypothetical protein ONZ45_g16394 [Pleurotus djamor]
MLIWLDGSLNPDKLKDRILSDPAFTSTLVTYLEDNIWNKVPVAPLDIDVPSDKFHASSLRSVQPSEPHSLPEREKDLRNTVKACQVLSLRCDEGLTNDYNATILEATRCNMDIKFIGSGISAKAVLYYVTDYITKSDMPAHTSYSALELAVRRLGDHHQASDIPAIRSKRMLQKCAHAMISRQEIAAPFVAAYLLGNGDHYTSHRFKSLYWRAFERFIMDEEQDAQCDLESTRNELHPDMPNDPIESVDSTRDEIKFGTDEDGAFSPKSTQVNDYLYRSKAFESFSVWDMIAQLDRITQSTRAYERPISQTHYTFLHGHPDKGTHLLCVRPRKFVHVPVPIGPGIPRRDRDVTYDRHARLMLILFKPWRTLADLRPENLTWAQAYDDFLVSAPPHVHTVINNMQLLHECRDSRDDHFETMRRNRRANGPLRADGESGEDDTGLGDALDQTEVLEHLESIDMIHSSNLADSNLAVTEAMLSAVESGLIPQSPTVTATAGIDIAILSMTKLIDETHHREEQIWKKVYATLSSEKLNPQPELENPSQSHVSLTDQPDVSISTPKDSMWDMDIEAPTIYKLPLEQGLSGEAIMDRVEAEYTLNVEQSRAFRIVAAHSLSPATKQLRMYLMGSGGTGKSRVIQALTKFFNAQLQLMLVAQPFTR